MRYVLFTVFVVLFFHSCFSFFIICYYETSIQVPNRNGRRRYLATNSTISVILTAGGESSGGQPYVPLETKRNPHVRNPST